MPALFIQVGQSAHDAERQALRFIVEALPANYTVYGNPWLVERSGVIYELDAVVVAPHAVYVVEIKAWRGRIDGTDNDWLIPYPIPSPLKLNRKTAQVLKSELRARDFQAGQVWTEGLVFLSATTDVHVDGPASRDRIHTRKTLHAALQDPALVERLSGRGRLAPTDPAQKEILHLFNDNRNSGKKPVRRVREYEILGALDRQDTFSELLARNTLTDVPKVLRIYGIPPLATAEQEQRIRQRTRWEAQVLTRLGRVKGILPAEQPFEDEAGIVLPFEYFKGVTLTTWLSRYVAGDQKNRADLQARTGVWLGIAQAIDEAHRHGVVHRLLRPDTILVDDSPKPKAIRVTGFDLAKQATIDATIYSTSLGDDRLVYAAPEVVRAFSSAEPASDQFSLGAILALLLTGKPIFSSTRQLMAERRLLRRVRDLAPRIPLTLDEAVSKMVSIRPTDRFATLREAIEAVRVGRDPERVLTLPGMAPQKRMDIENLEPDTRIGTDYEIVARLGEGGMSVVYAARHLVSGRTRALKIARNDAAAEEALRNEHEVLDALDHPNIVPVKDLSKMIEGRLTLVMERVSGETLRQWIARHPKPEPATQRRFAEDLLSGLEYLENKGVTHKDLKPDNLLVGDHGLTIIDFSLAHLPADATYGGTALYRDPSSLVWSHATDRYAAALCLFELYAGRHAFEGRVPEPDEAPTVREEDVHPSGLAAFFEKALAAIPDRRFPSARAMRDAFLVALGVDVGEKPVAPRADDVQADTPLRLAGLSRRAVKKLSGAQVHTVGDLLALPPSHVRAIHAIGMRTAEEIIAFQDALRARGLSAGAGSAVSVDPALVPALIDCPEPVAKLPLPQALVAALEQGGCPTVGAVAALPAGELLRFAGIGRSRLAQIVEALHAFAERTDSGTEGPHTLDRFWELASRPLDDDQKSLVERSMGLGRDRENAVDIAADLGRTPATVSSDLSTALERLDRTMLAEPTAALDNFLDTFGGIVRLEQIAARLEEEWPGGEVSGEGFIRLLVRISFGRAHLLEINDEDVVVARPIFDRDTLRAFTAEVRRIAEQWPPQDPESARRTLAGLLPHFDSDPLALAVRVTEDVGVTEGGHLFLAPIEDRRMLEFALERVRGRIDLEELERAVRRSFGETAVFPQGERLITLLNDLGCRVEGTHVLPASNASVVALPPLSDDPGTLGAPRSDEEIVRDMLAHAAFHRGFRMLITPPEKHAEIGRSVAETLNGKWISFEDRFFRKHAGQISVLERAEQFVAQRDMLTEAAEELMDEILDEHGQPGQCVVVGDTALLGLCEAVDLPRRVYDETLSGERGFWVFVVPGVMYKNQPRFNEGPVMWHLGGATVSLCKPLTPQVR